MSLRDKLLGRRHSEPIYDDPLADSRPGDGPTAGREDIGDFSPRQDGDYRCDAAGLVLRFSRPVVIETCGAVTTKGEFTQAGRFTVQRTFERPVVYTVLERPADSLLLRRTDTGDRSSAELTFSFHPDPS